MITREFAKSQIKRLASRMFQPEQQQITDLVDALVATAETDEHAADIVGSFVYDTQVNEHGRPACPSPGDIVRVGHASRTTELRATATCQACNGSGWRIVEREGASGASRCGCWKAQPKVDHRAIASDPEVAREFAVQAKGMPRPSGERFRR